MNNEHNMKNIEFVRNLCRQIHPHRYEKPSEVYVKPVTKIKVLNMAPVEENVCVSQKKTIPSNENKNNGKVPCVIESIFPKTAKEISCASSQVKNLKRKYSSIKKYRKSDLYHFSRDHHLIQTERRHPSNTTSQQTSKNVHECSQRCNWCNSLEEFDPPVHTRQLPIMKKPFACLKEIHPDAVKRIDPSLKSHDVTPVTERLRTENIQKSKNPNEQNELSKLRKTVCSVSNCYQNSVNTLSTIEGEVIQKLFSEFNFSFIIEGIFCPTFKGRKQKPIIPLCDEHLHMINVITLCQLCSNKVEKMDFEDYKMYDHWNSVLSHNNILLTLQPGMFICLTCKSCITDNDFLSPINLHCLQDHVEKKKSERIKTFGIVNCATTIAKKSKQMDRKVTFLDPLVTSTSIFKPSTDNINEKKVLKNSISRLNNEVDKTMKIVVNLEPEWENCDETNDGVQMKLDEEVTIQWDYNSIVDSTTDEKSDEESDHDENVKNDVSVYHKHNLERTRFCG